MWTTTETKLAVLHPSKVNPAVGCQCELENFTQTFDSSLP